MEKPTTPHLGWGKKKTSGRRAWRRDRGIGEKLGLETGGGEGELQASRLSHACGANAGPFQRPSS